MASPHPFATLPSCLQSTAPHLQLLIAHLLVACQHIATLLAETRSVDSLSSVNLSGDVQLQLDVKTDELLMRACRLSGVCKIASSEEQARDVLMPIDSTNQAQDLYCVSFDSLDGSSVIGANWAVSSLISIFSQPTSDSNSIIPCKGRDIRVSMLVVYGSRLSMVLAVAAASSLSHFVFSPPDQKWYSDRLEPLILHAQCKTFSPANLKCAVDLSHYESIIQYYMRNAYTLRYSGALGPDVYLALLKGEGVFLSPSTARHKAKLRVLYELFAIALVIECAGGVAKDEEAVNILDLQCSHFDQRSELIAGSSTEVERYFHFKKQSTSLSARL